MLDLQERIKKPAPPAKLWRRRLASGRHARPGPLPLEGNRRTTRARLHRMVRARMPVLVRLHRRISRRQRAGLTPARTSSRRAGGQGEGPAPRYQVMAQCHSDRLRPTLALPPTSRGWFREVQGAARPHAAYAASIASALPVTSNVASTKLCRGRFHFSARTATRRAPRNTDTSAATRR